LTHAKHQLTYTHSSKENFPQRVRSRGREKREQEIDKGEYGVVAVSERCRGDIIFINAAHCAGEPIIHGSVEPGASRPNGERHSPSAFKVGVRRLELLRVDAGCRTGLWPEWLILICAAPPSPSADQLTRAGPSIPQQLAG
jgi:hypothetical protein